MLLSNKNQAYILLYYWINEFINRNDWRINLTECEWMLINENIGMNMKKCKWIRTNMNMGMSVNEWE